MLFSPVFIGFSKIQEVVYFFTQHSELENERRALAAHLPLSDTLLRKKIIGIRVSEASTMMYSVASTSFRDDTLTARTDRRYCCGAADGAGIAATAFR